MYDYFFGNDNLYFVQLKLLQRHTNEFKIIKYVQKLIEE